MSFFISMDSVIIDHIGQLLLLTSFSRLAALDDPDFSVMAIKILFCIGLLFLLEGFVFCLLAAS